VLVSLNVLQTYARKWLCKCVELVWWSVLYSFDMSHVVKDEKVYVGNV
jgi:hypothetical protein